MTSFKLDPSWSNAEAVSNHLETLSDILSPNQKRLLTPVFVNSTTLEVLKDAYTQMFKITGVNYSPHAFRYSYSFKVAGKNIMATTLYHLERDFTRMMQKYGVVAKADTLKLANNRWEAEAYAQLKWFKGTAEQAVNKLITCKGKDGNYYGWYFKELQSDNPVK